MKYMLTPHVANFAYFAWWDNIFEEHELNYLQDLTKRASKEATIGSGLNSTIRRTKVAWLDCSDETRWVFDRFATVVSNLNASYFNLDLTGFVESIQLTNYLSEDSGMYEWHCDNGPGISRKLSVVLQLSHPDEYDGGELQIKTGMNEDIIQKKRGLITVFPSYTLHRVTPVTKGTRQTIVSWITGPRFR
jgi:PKHD-type hydroxylase